MRNQIFAALGSTVRRTVTDGRGNRVPQAEAALEERLKECYRPPSSARADVLADVIAGLYAGTSAFGDPQAHIRTDLSRGGPLPQRVRS